MKVSSIIGFTEPWERKLKEFELNLSPYGGSGYHATHYTFSHECFNILLRCSNYLSSVKSLKSLCLEVVNITQEIVEFFIYNCPFLDQLRVAYSNLSRRVVGSSTQLKHFDIHKCDLIEEVEISDPSLLSFKYIGNEIKLHVDNVPLLLNVSMGSGWWPWPWVPITLTYPEPISTWAASKGPERAPRNWRNMYLINLLDTKNKGILDLEDWVSQLPDDILVNVISRLTVNEAARTSVLASRWKCLWTCSTTLNFEDPQKLLYVYNLRRASDEERCKYIGWVNRVLELRADSNINEFRIRFDLKDLHKSAINHWIYTAIDKGVEKLELNLKPYNEGVSYIDQYTFSEKFFNKLKTIPHFLSSVNALRSLRLEAVNITKEILKFFIYNCPFLEQLLVAYSSTLSSFKVVGSSIQLKSLDIQCCHLLEEIEISAPSLVSFKYIGGEIKLHLTNVAQLVDVWIGGSAFCVARIRNLIYSIKSILPQLKTLDLQKYRSTMESIHDFLPCTLPKLRQLTIEIFVGSSDRSLIGRRKDIHRYEKRPHQHLKVVELVGFCGFPVELELAINLLENATLLERMIVELPSASTWSERIRECARESTKTLTDYIPPAVDLVTH
ncbi:hypothetical protein Pint_09638 [Pistacia integerrima]|uniref:Uncharacterized protein n=1 Tax=Pistacia integerrima TaxID=434235 RepID=A0ACC0XIX8_9ROSI|nr:hypothetical protein Pint_09638 [Pistacia integerrima]